MEIPTNAGIYMTELRENENTETVYWIQSEVRFWILEDCEYGILATSANMAMLAALKPIGLNSRFLGKPRAATFPKLSQI